jgi:hypothetical protein
MKRLFALALLAAVGCGPVRPATHPVSGVVKYRDGELMRVGVVVFTPSVGAPSARGVVDGEGQFKLGTFEADDGAIVGPHRVAVMQPQLATGELRAAPGDDIHGAASQRFAPRRYASPATSGLSAEVKPGDNRVELILDTE